MIETVILVDTHDIAIGEMEKMEAHIKAKLHRAVSVFICNSKGQMLLQKRAMNKYHSPGLWTNTACTHPRVGENNMEAATRRLHEEMGIKDVRLTELFDFIYKEPLDNNLTEHELDHVFLGFSDLFPNPNPEEVCDYKYVNLDSIPGDIEKNPEEYTVWFRKIIERVLLEVKQDRS